MNKSDLIAATAEKADISKTEAKRVLETMVVSIQESLSRGERVSFKGFGTFSLKQRPLRRVRNIHTKEIITVPSTRVTGFKPGKNLKDLVNKKESPEGVVNIKEEVIKSNEKEAIRETEAELAEETVTETTQGVEGTEMTTEQETEKRAEAKYHQPKVIAVTSGKGGTGKTNFVINTAIALARRGLNVYLIDADLGTANVDVLLGIHSKQTINSLIENKDMNLMDIVVEGPEGIKLIPGGSGLQALAELPGDELARIISMFKPIEEFADVIIIDTGSGISRNVVEFAVAADEIVVVITPEPHSISDAYAIIKVLSTHEIRPPIKMVFNLVENSREAEMVSSRLTEVTRKFLDFAPQTIGYILKDENVVKSVKQFKPFVLYNPLSPASRCVQAISEKLVPPGEEEIIPGSGKKEKRGFLGKLKTLFAKSGT